MRKFATMGQQLARDQMCTGQHSTQTDLSPFGLLPAALCEHSLSPQHSTRLGKGLSRCGWVAGWVCRHTWYISFNSTTYIVCQASPCVR